MNLNPYEPPGPHDDRPGIEPPQRTIFILAAIGAWIAGAYWAALTLLLGLGVAAGSVSATQIILPCVLIGLYAVRGFQIFKGDPAAARRVLWLHGIGGIVALVQMFSGGALLIVLQAFKVAIHGFGAVTAYLAGRALSRGRT